MSTPTYTIPLAIVPKFWELAQADMKARSHTMPDLTLRELARKEGGVFTLMEVSGKRAAMAAIKFNDEQKAVEFKLKYAA